MDRGARTVLESPVGSVKLARGASTIISKKKNSEKIPHFFFSIKPTLAPPFVFFFTQSPKPPLTTKQHPKTFTRTLLHTQTTL
jgi:hypothetical protein